MQNLAQVQNGRFAPHKGHNAHAVGENRPEMEKLMIKKPNVDICISHTLHLALLTCRVQSSDANR